MWGHVANRFVDQDEVYSYGTGGWHQTAYSLDGYLRYNAYRDVLALEVRLSPDELASVESTFRSLRTDEPGYNALWCNCTDAPERALEGIGLDLGINVTPFGLGTALIDSGRVRNIRYYPATDPDVMPGGGIVEEIRERWNQR
jgi:hypothetical protein